MIFIDEFFKGIGDINNNRASSTSVAGETGTKKMIKCLAIFSLANHHKNRTIFK